MMPRIVFVLILFFAVASCAVPKPKVTENTSAEVTYAVRIGQDAEHPKIYVDLSFPAKDVGSFALKLMPNLGVDHCLQPEYQILKTGNIVRDPKHETGVSLISGAPENAARPISVSYVITPDFRSLSQNVDEVSGCAPIRVGVDHFYADGSALFFAVRPIDTSGQVFRFHFASVTFNDPYPAPEVFSSIGAIPKNTSFSINELWKLRSSVFVGGDYEASQHKQRGTTISTYSVPALADEGRQVTNELFRAAQYYSQQWDIPLFSEYAIFLSLAPGSPTNFGGFTGTAKFNSQTNFVTPKTNHTAMLHVMLHELAHWWLPNKLGVLDMPDPGWIREGLTEYAASRAMVATGVVKSDFLVRRLNLALQNLGLKHTPELQDYDAGFSRAFALDARNLSTAGHERGVNDLIRTLMHNSDGALTEQKYLHTAQKLGLLPETTAPELKNIRLPCAVRIGGKSLKLQHAFWPVYETGFKLKPDGSGEILSVLTGSAAERAGLASGQYLVRIKSGGFGDIHEPLILEVRGEADKISNVSYLPRGSLGNVAYDQYVDMGTQHPYWIVQNGGPSCQP